MKNINLPPSFFGSEVSIAVFSDAGFGVFSTEDFCGGSVPGGKGSSKPGGAGSPSPIDGFCNQTNDNQSNQSIIHQLQRFSTGGDMSLPEDIPDFGRRYNTICCHEKKIKAFLRSNSVALQEI